MRKTDSSENPHSEELNFIRNRFMSMKRWSRGGKRAPHKPLLALLAIVRCLKGYDRLTAYEELRRELLPLLQEFAPYQSSLRPEYPFWRMKNDRQIWEIPNQANVEINSSGDASSKNLLEARIEAGFPEIIYEAFRSNPDFAFSLAHELVNAHFPETLHERILQAAGMAEAANLTQADRNKIWVRKSARDSKFRERVLTAYNNRCAVCRYSMRICEDLVGLEAAHIKWHQHRGPDIVQNGVALCSIHHKLFDSGAFTFTPDLSIFVSVLVSGSGRPEWLDRFNGKSFQLPADESLLPAEEFLAWHGRDVFRGPSPALQVRSKS
ncbi:MAG: HNH endonuclease [Albidovulum sp.]|nr:HNH endonuclease [Albidovulum sp.]MDE0532669.1 HNH endonuclease [Albidovulum sp.]